MDRGACRATVHSATKSRTRRKQLIVHAHTHTHMGFSGGASGKEPACQCKKCKRWVQSLSLENPLEEGVATHSSILAWRMLWTEEPGLQSMELEVSDTA